MELYLNKILYKFLTETLNGIVLIAEDKLEYTLIMIQKHTVQKDLMEELDDHYIKLSILLFKIIFIIIYMLYFN